jgi:tRNA(Ile)-lysidine synthase TilS/MesJ
MNTVETLKTLEIVEKVRICKICVLSDNMDGVRLDDEGVCNHCRKVTNEAQLQRWREEDEADFIELADKVRGQSAYDVVVGWSGGKDSTYTVAMLKERYGLRVLGFSFDNGFVSPTALKNLNVVSENLGVDLMIVKPPLTLMQQIFQGSVADKEMYSRNALHRASVVCNSCMGLAKFIALRIAIEKKIPLMAFGWTPGQQTGGRMAAMFPTNPKIMRTMMEASQKPLRALAGDAIRPYFLEEEHFADASRFPWNVSPLAWIDYDEEKIKEHIKQYGWEKPTDTDPNSTNCLLNTFANVVHIKQFGFNPYAKELAGLVRQGKMSREEALERLNTKEDPKVLQKVEERLGMKA